MHQQPPFLAYIDNCSLDLLTSDVAGRGGQILTSSLAIQECLLSEDENRERVAGELESNGVRVVEDPGPLMRRIAERVRLGEDEISIVTVGWQPSHEMAELLRDIEHPTMEQGLRDMLDASKERRRDLKEALQGASLLGEPPEVIMQAIERGSRDVHAIGWMVAQDAEVDLSMFPPERLPFLFAAPIWRTMITVFLAAGNAPTKIGAADIAHACYVELFGYFVTEDDKLRKLVNSIRSSGDDQSAEALSYGGFVERLEDGAV